MSYPDYERARAVFDWAVGCARSEEPVPPEWLERTARVGAARSKTYTAALGTALLARATDAHVDPLTLQAGAPAARGYRAYTARSLAQHVLAPKAAQHGISIRTTGGEPLNNQPFFAEPRVHRGIKARYPDDWHALVDAMERVHELSRDEARLALAAFIRSRLSDTPYDFPALWHASPDVAYLVDRVAQFVLANPEGGRRGQAMVAASLDVSFEDVTMGRVNDPSRRVPGDVFRGPVLAPDLAVEVKQRPADAAEVLRFVQRASDAGLARVGVALLAQDQTALDVQPLQERALAEHGVALELIQSAVAWLAASIVWARSAGQFVTDFPRAMHMRLLQIEVDRASLGEWAGLWAEPPAASGRSANPSAGSEDEPA